MISNGEKREQPKKLAFFSKIHISAIFKDVAHISGESIVIHMYFMSWFLVPMIISFYSYDY